MVDSTNPAAYVKLFVEALSFAFFLNAARPGQATNYKYDQISPDGTRKGLGCVLSTRPKNAFRVQNGRVCRF